MNASVIWLFCTVIDNFGDIGVSWRLARELHARLNAEVHLWLDDEAALRHIAPDFTQSPIHLHAWQEGQAIDFQTLKQPDLILEMFACTLPENVVDLIKQQNITWLNWEYLSAEDWAVRTHAMPSLQSNGSRKYFWQMGFQEQTGGLLREANYQAQYQAFRQPEHLDVQLFVFGYASDVWAKWFQTWQEYGQAMTIHLAGQTVIQSLKQAKWLPETAFQQQSEYFSGCLKLKKIDFVPQADFDRLLWAHDLLIIRGEDSFVRAQWAGKPFFWHIYPQDEQAHLVKLNAFWRLPEQQCSSEPFQAAFHALSQELNQGVSLSNEKRLHHWHTLMTHRAQWQQQAQTWQNYLFNQSDAVSRLAQWWTNKDK